MLRRENEFLFLPIFSRFESRQEVDKPLNACCWPNEQRQTAHKVSGSSERKRREFKLLKVFSFSLFSFQFGRGSLGQGKLWSVVNGFCKTYETNYTQDGSTEALLLCPASAPVGPTWTGHVKDISSKASEGGSKNIASLSLISSINFTK